jgi:hypothetical protein
MKPESQIADAVEFNQGNRISNADLGHKAQQIRASDLPDENFDLGTAAADAAEPTEGESPAAASVAPVPATEPGNADDQSRNLKTGLFFHIKRQPNIAPLQLAVLAAQKELNETRQDLTKRGLQEGAKRHEIRDLETAISAADSVEDVIKKEAAAHRMALLDPNIRKSLRLPSIAPSLRWATAKVGQLHTEVCKASHALIGAALAHVPAYLAKAKADEAAFFSAYGLPAEPTAVTRNAEAAQRQIENMRRSFQEPGTLHTHLPWSFDAIGILKPLL